MKVEEESEEVGLKLNIQKTKIMVWPHHFMGNRWRNSGNNERLYFLGSKITAVGDFMKLKAACSLEEKL